MKLNLVLNPPGLMEGVNATPRWTAVVDLPPQGLNSRYFEGNGPDPLTAMTRLADKLASHIEQEDL